MKNKLMITLGLGLMLGLAGTANAGSWNHNPCNPCAMKSNNPCSMETKHNPCAMNPCSMKTKHNPCAMNPCSMKTKHNPCAMNPCASMDKKDKH